VIGCDVRSFRISDLQVGECQRDPKEINSNIVSSLRYLSEKQKQLMSYCLAQQDFVTFDVAQDLSETTEKFTWMFRSFLKETSPEEISEEND